MNYNTRVFQKIGICIFIFLSSIGTGISQESTLPDSVASKPRALELVQIPDFGNETRTLVNDIQQLIENTEFTREITPGIQELVNLINTKYAVFNESIKEYKLDRLEKEERELGLFNDRIKPWKNTVQNIRAEGQAKDSVIRVKTLVWQLTLESMELSVIKSQNDNTNALTPTSDLKTEVKNFIDELEVAKTSLYNYLDTVRNIQAEITFAENKLGNISSLIASRKGSLVQNIWIPESPPIWQVEQDSLALNIKSKLTYIMHSDWSIVKTFLKNNTKMPYYVLFLFVVVFGIILYLKSNAKKLYSNEFNEPLEAQIVLQSPFLTVLILLWFGSLFFSFFPKEFIDFISMVMLVPLAIMLYRLNTNWKAQTVVVFSLTYLLFLLVKDVDYSYLTQRLFLLGVTLFSLALFLYLKKQKSFVSQNNKYWFGSFSHAIQFFILLNILALLANVFGSIRLVQLFAHASLGFIICIYALHASVVLARNLVFLILMGPLYEYSNILKEDREMVLHTIDKLFRLLGFIAVLIVVLNLFGIRVETINAAKTIITYQLKVGQMSLSLGNIIAFFLTIQISIWLSSLIRYVLEKEVYPRASLKAGIPNTISLMIKFTFVLLGLLLAFSAAGIEMDKLAILMGALGVGIGFGLQNIIANFVSGIILALERPMTIGDIIDIPGASGYVKDIGIRASIVRNWDGSDVIVPNGELVSNKLTNWTFYDRERRVKVEVRVPFDSNIEKVSKLLLDTAAEIPEVMKKPKAYLNFKGIGESAMEIDLFCWTNDSDKIFSYGTAIRKAVYKALLEAGYDTPVPVQDLKIARK